MLNLDFESLRNSRASNPVAVSEALANRKRRAVIQGDGKLFIVAADHPARGALGIRKDEMAMADRYDLLTRLATALSRPGVDGVLGTPDIIDDLALLGCLDDKLVVGSMNRGGLRGATFEMDDRYTAYDIESIARDGLDFAKNLIRINLADAGSVNTLESSAAAVDEAVEAKMPIMLEPFMSEWVNGSIKNDLSADAVIKSIAIASGLGNSSAYSWLKLPVVDDMARVMASTTLPTLLLGGDPAEGEEEKLFVEWGNALSLPGVRGLVVGRSLLYPAKGDLVTAIDAAAALVHTNLN
jgi:DhnA family fructose-bisphosphate aldolase class Ia